MTEGFTFEGAPGEETMNIFGEVSKPVKSILMRSRPTLVLVFCKGHQDQ